LFWPKVLWDFASSRLDVLVRPFPYLQAANILCGCLGLLHVIARALFQHQKLLYAPALTVALYSMNGAAAILLYQGTNAALYYLIGIVIFLCSYA
jgi:hypothetical protein